ncbi:MAG: M48 family metallopeptidase [Gammaproteobacteria bacterium]|nr:M48 family metallopeptidase [Gammaproteobacteria bacterium]MBV8306059.1 M48 family metallopeptidase [Gammaproteobacteria bacterium]
MRRLIVFLATALLFAATLAAAGEPGSSQPILNAPVSGSDLPDLGSPAATVLTQNDEYLLGAMVAKQLRDQSALLEDPEVSEYINNIGQRLASQSAMGGQNFHYFVVKDTTINAFAVTGGYVFINAGLILATSTESELAGVMAHETAHITQHHIARMLADQSRQSLTTAAAMIGAILLGALGGGQAVEGALAATQGMAVQHQINFTRDNESEADRVGISYLAGAGFDPYGMGSMFETMSRHEGLAATYIPAMLIDHPMDSDRIAEQRSRAAQFPPHKVHDSLSYDLIRERVRVLTATGDTDLAVQYAQKIAHGGDNLGNRYGEALALMNSNRADEAVKMLTPLVQQHEGLTLLYSALGQAQARAGHTKEALATFERAEQLFPRNVPVTVRYAETLMSSGRPAEAHNMLLDLFNNVPPTPDQIRLTALAASAAGDPGDAYFYMGEYHLAEGDLNLAAQQLQLALASPHISPIQRQRYQARLEEVREYLASMRKRQVADNGDGQGQHGGGH